MKINFNTKAKAIGLSIVLATSGICSTGCTVTIDSPEDIIDYIEIEEKKNNEYVISIKPTENSTDEPTEEVSEVTTTTDSSTILETTTDAVSYEEKETTQNVHTTITTGSSTIVTTTETIATTTVPVTTMSTTTTANVSTTYTETKNDTGLYENGLTVKRNEPYMHKCGQNEFLPLIASYYGITLDELKSTNNIPENQDTADVGTYLTVPATLIYGNVKEGESINELAIKYGVTPEYLCKINDVDNTNYEFNKDSQIITYVLPNNQYSYDIAYAKMNIIYDKFVIAGDKLLSPHGWAGSSLNTLAFAESRFESTDNSVILYQYDGGDNLYYKCVADNVKDIGLTPDGETPIIYLKDSYVYGTMYNDDQSCVFDGYDVHFDDNYNPILTFDNNNYELYYYTPELQKVR